jgi:hypothetical protein
VPGSTDLAGRDWLAKDEADTTLFRHLENGYDVHVDIVFLIGAAEFSIPREDAHRLEAVIRKECADLHGRPLDENARACLALADAIRNELQNGGRPKPIELGRSHVEGLCAHVIEHEEIASVALLADLCDALRRYREPQRR